MLNIKNKILHKFSEVFKIVFLRGMVFETLETFATNYTEQMQVQQFIADWSQNFMLQAVAPTTTIELTLKETAQRIDAQLNTLQKLSDTDLMALISLMRQLSLVLFVYHHQTRLLQSKHHIKLLDFRNTILWISDMLERHIIVKYNIEMTLK